MPPHNEIPKKVAAAEGGGHLFGRAAEGRPSLCGDLWTPMGDSNLERGKGIEQLYLCNIVEQI